MPLERQGSENLLRFNIPRATYSNLELAVDGPVLGESISQSVLLNKVNEQPGASLLRAQGLAGEFELSWRSQETASQELASVLRARGSMIVRIDGRSLRRNTTLTVESFGGDIDRFYVKLPPGAALVDRDGDDSIRSENSYSLIQLKVGEIPDGVIQTDAEQQWVLVRLPVRQRGPVNVELNTEQPLGLDGDDLSAELGGFQVKDAFRQFGEVSIHVDKNWQVQWDPGRYVRRVDLGSLQSSKEDAPPTATFQYDRQLWSLRAHVQALESFVQATPQYELLLLPDEARLRIEIDYHIPGAPAIRAAY